jgi:site-specific DNA recombinase
MVSRFGIEARKRLRDESGGFRRHYVQGLVQRVEVADDEVRITGTPERLLQSLASLNVSSSPEVRGFEPRWLRG